MIWIWIAFIAFILLLLALDLGVFHRKAHAVSLKEALGWTAVWMTLGLGFTAFIYAGYEHHWLGLGTAVDAVDGRVNDGTSAAVKYVTGYVVEKSLSVDNVFVIAMIFTFLAVPAIYQHRVLFWGILGALVLRGGMIYLGASLIARYHWVLYIFGGILIVTAVKMLFARTHADPARSPLVRLARRVLPLTDDLHGEHFVVRAGAPASSIAATPGGAVARDEAVMRARAGKWLLTPLALALIVVEATDLVFAVDSIPAIFAITADPFLVFTSNVFAILGLRSLYFALAGMMDRFRYLKVSLAAVLMVVGLKMLAAPWLKATVGPNVNLYLLALVLGILAIGVVGSLLNARRSAQEVRAEGAVEAPRTLSA
jgi:tellurite resistance protein TerC